MYVYTYYFIFHTHSSIRLIVHVCVPRRYVYDVPPLPKVPRYAYPPTESLPQDVQSGSAPVLAIVSVVDPNQEVQMPMDVLYQVYNNGDQQQQTVCISIRYMYNMNTAGFSSKLASTKN